MFVNHQNSTSKAISTSIISFVIFLLVTVFLSCSNSESEKAPAGPTLITQVEQITTDYENNSLAAKEKYVGKIIQIEGIITSIGEDIAGRPYIILSNSAQCLFSKDQLVKLKKIAVGDFKKVIGTCTGKLLYIQMKECKLGN